MQRLIRRMAKESPHRSVELHAVKSFKPQCVVLAALKGFGLFPSSCISFRQEITDLVARAGR